MGLVLMVLVLGCSRQLHPTPSAPPAREITPSREAAQRLSERFATALAQPGPVQLTLYEDELTSYLALNAGEGALRGITVWLTGEGAYLAGQLTFGKKLYPLAALVTVTSERGQPRLRLLWFTLAGRSVPRWVQRSLEQALNDALTDAHLPLDLQEVRWSEGSLTLVGSVP
jgi:hypothetical protein